MRKIVSLGKDFNNWTEFWKFVLEMQLWLLAMTGSTIVVYVLVVGNGALEWVGLALALLVGAIMLLSFFYYGHARNHIYVPLFDRKNKR